MVSLIEDAMPWCTTIIMLILLTSYGIFYCFCNVNQQVHIQSNCITALDSACTFPHTFLNEYQIQRAVYVGP